MQAFLCTKCCLCVEKDSVGGMQKPCNVGTETLCGGLPGGRLTTLSPLLRVSLQSDERANPVKSTCALQQSIEFQFSIISSDAHFPCKATGSEHKLSSRCHRDKRVCVLIQATPVSPCAPKLPTFVATCSSMSPKFDHMQSAVLRV